MENKIEEKEKEIIDLYTKLITKFDDCKPEEFGVSIIGYTPNIGSFSQVSYYDFSKMEKCIEEAINYSISISNDKDIRRKYVNILRRLARNIENVTMSKFEINETDKDLELNEYQSMALETAIYPEEYKIIYPSLGLTGEAGEVSDKVKKVIRDKNCEFTEEAKKEIAKEIGDVLWYIATLSNDIGYTLADIARINYNKLKSRQERHKINGSGDNR